MIAAMALRLLYLIFSRLLDSLTLLSLASASKNLERRCCVGDEDECPLAMEALFRWQGRVR